MSAIIFLPIPFFFIFKQSFQKKVAILNFDLLKLKEVPLERMI